MRLEPAQLPAALAQGLAPVYLISGDEPLTAGEAADAVRAAARKAGFTERIVFSIDRSFAWDELKQAAREMSLFAERRLFELRNLQGRPRDENQEHIRSLCDNAYLGGGDSLCRVLGRFKMFVDTNDIGTFLG